MIEFDTSKTKENLMRAFAGESQARNRYTFAASAAKKEGYSILEDLFTYTADQEKTAILKYKYILNFLMLKQFFICNFISCYY